MVDGSTLIGSPNVIADSERNMPGIKPGPLGAITTDLQEKGKTKSKTVNHLDVIWLNRSKKGMDGFNH